MTHIRLLLVDDHEVVRLGLRALLERHPQFEVIGEAATADEAVRAVREGRPDVVVMDIRLPGKSGIEACREIKQIAPGCRVIMLTSFANDEFLVEAINAGASGYVLKQLGSNALAQAIEAVARGESQLDGSLVSMVFDKLRQATQHGRGEAFADLTEQELHILALIRDGKTNREISRALSLSEKTVRNYVSSILSKLDLS
ncbi:MAG: response regulator transcription factor, partial [Chloroflexi bacterium]|nr:response regulator transcription factor [Chloroflexota bacterium]